VETVVGLIAVHRSLVRLWYRRMLTSRALHYTNDAGGRNRTITHPRLDATRFTTYRLRRIYTTASLALPYHHYFSTHFTRTPPHARTRLPGDCLLPTLALLTTGVNTANSVHGEEVGGAFTAPLFISTLFRGGAGLSSGKTPGASTRDRGLWHREGLNPRQQAILDKTWNMGMDDHGTLRGGRAEPACDKPPSIQALAFDMPF